jgi:hypothetical protein
MPIPAHVAFLVLLGLPADDSKAGGALDVFRREIRPILAGQCLRCHNHESRKGGLDLSQRERALAGGETGPAVVPGKPEESEVVDRVAGGRMPPKQPLAAAQVEAFRAWIAAGAPYDGGPISAGRAGPDWWSLQPIGRPSAPQVKDRDWARNPIDAFVLAKLETKGLYPAPETDRTSLIRRATFDLTGLPPTPEEIEAFANDPAPDAYERVVDRLMESPRYGERWGRHWLDVARFGESHGYETNQLRPNAWPYRDWVIRAFNLDLPFSRFVAEQLAGDTMHDADWLAKCATGFLVGGAHDVVGNQTLEGQRQQRADDLDDMITAVGTAFLGLTVQCARCHDHKFDPIRQSDYYGLKAALAGIQHAERELLAPDVESRGAERASVVTELAHLDRLLDDAEPLACPSRGAPYRPAVAARRNVERFRSLPARFVRFTVQATNNGAEPCIDELEVWTAEPTPRDIALAAAGARPTASSVYPNSPIHRLEHINDGQIGNSRSWISAAPGKGWIQIEFAEVALIDRIVWGRDREERFRDRLPTEYYIEAAVEPGDWRVVASSADRLPYKDGADPADPPGLSAKQAEQRRSLLARQSELRARLEALSDTIRVYAGTFAEAGPTHLLRRGDVMQQGPEVAPSVVGCVNPPLEMSPGWPESKRRIALALWIADPANPLPARVAVNRVWQHHFGRGLVATPGDFGFQGQAPSHPELLDWLARFFLDAGGRLKRLHRLIVLSATYRQSSHPNSKAQALDAQNTLLWRMAPRRLEAEAIRDAILAASGQLDDRMAGPGYTIWKPNTNYVAVFDPLRDLGPSAFRRMVYQFKPRSQQDPTFGAFDCPDAALAAPKRNVSTTALQSLNLLNSRFILQQSRAFASRLHHDAGDDPEAQAQRGFRLAFGRKPDAVELAAAVALIREHGAAAFGRALFNANEFIYAP